MANDDPQRANPWFNRLAHDLRSPLSSLQTAAYLLRTDPGGSNSRELADIVVRQSQRMARMVDELDDWARAQQRRLVDRSERLEIGGIVDMAVGSVHGCTIDPHYSDGAAEMKILGDSSRLAQMFRTLLEQTLARDAQGARVDVTANDASVVVVFADNGAVVDEALRTQLLEAPQVPPPDEGLGLRLLIAKAIAEGHAGSIVIEGPGDGASQRIRCELPVA
ncbi:PAS/PAC sensor hybrid histidine kinase [Lysobacter dokdonensis DS-58]|uniref:histidine kinase n=1 Tax=Lysobacter dokdonensis DS-58 TaxID=1300345 RepID=A0A0A2WIY0_9GAMM|nr:HAMP domain-containing sensor histidine kinase [Lysobacter dokdonensis]KGQ18195.1 PAS/PAC sensor hybrid histidine kinase [Lysobacter dokdonensis DS-58]